MVAQLNAVVREALGASDVRGRFDAIGFRVIAGSPERYADLMAVDYDGYSRTIRITGVMPE